MCVVVLRFRARTHWIEVSPKAQSSGIDGKGVEEAVDVLTQATVR